MTLPGVPNQNLINPARATQGARIPGFWKAIALDVLSVGSALLFGYLYLRYLALGASPWLVLVALLFFSALSVLQVFLAPKSGRRTLVILGEAIALVVVFIGYDGWQVASITAAIAFIVLTWGYLASRAEAKNSMEVSFFRATRNVLGKVTTASLLVMILVYAPQAEGRGVFIPHESFKTFFNWASGLLSNFYPGVPFTGTFGSFSENLAKMELENNPTFATLTPSAQKNAVEQAVTQLGAGVKRFTGIAPTSDEPLSDVIYSYIVTALANWKNQFGERFVIAWAIALFLVLRTFGIVFVWLAQFVSLVVYELLLAAGFMHITEISQTKEVVEY